MFGTVVTSTGITSAGNNVPQHDLATNNIFIEKSSDILIGNKTQFNGSVVIQNFIAGSEGQNPFVSNLGTLDESSSGKTLSLIELNLH